MTTSDLVREALDAESAFVHGARLRYAIDRLAFVRDNDAASWERAMKSYRYLNKVLRSSHHGATCATCEGRGEVPFKTVPADRHSPEDILFSSCHFCGGTGIALTDEGRALLKVSDLDPDATYYLGEENR